MTRSEQERLVERYLSGEMLSADEEEFFMQVAVDRDLRQTLKAYRIVESALRKHRDNAPQHHDHTRARVVAMLGTHAPAQSMRATGTHVARTSKVAGTHIMMSQAALQWVLGSVAALALVVGAFVVAPLVNSPSSSTEHQPRITGTDTPTAAVSKHPIESAIPSPTMAAPAPSGAPGTQSETTLRGTEPGVRRIDASSPINARNEGVTGTSPKGKKNSVKPREREQRRDSVNSQMSSSNQPVTLKRKKAPPIVMRDSSLRVNVKVDLPK